MILSYILDMRNFDQASLLASLKAFDHDPVFHKAHLYNALSLLHESLPPHSWIGFYLYDERARALVLGPFAGTPACERIELGKGVVGACFNFQKTIVVPDVRDFPGYISCDPLAAAELVVPVYQRKQLHGVLDIDYPQSYSFEGEQPFYEEVAKILEPFIC